MKKYKVSYYLTYNGPEEIEATDKIDACSQIMFRIMDDIGFYIAVEAEEINEKFDEHQDYENNKLEEDYRKEN